MSRKNSFLDFGLPSGENRDFARRFGKTFLLASLACWLATPVQAATLVSSLQGTELSANPVGVRYWLASSFQTPAQTWSLSSITVIAAQAAEANLALRLYSGDANGPSTTLADLKLVSLDPEAFRATFAPTSSVTLPASSILWVAAGGTSDQPLSLGYQDSGSFQFSAASGASMTCSFSGASISGSTPPAPNSWSPAETGLALLFQVDGTPATTPITRPTILPLTTSGTNLLVQFQAQAGVTYVLQAADSLNTTPAWSDISTTNSTGGLITIPVPFKPAAAQQFFRLRVPVP